MTVRQLRADVYLAAFPGALAERYAAGTSADALPADVRDRISNPAAWVDVEPEPEPVAAAPGPAFDPANPDDLDGVDDLDESGVEVSATAEPADEPADGDGPVQPPRTGRGASDGAWRDYAAALGQPVGAGATRGDVIAQLTAAGLIESEG